MGWRRVVWKNRARCLNCQNSGETIDLDLSQPSRLPEDEKGCGTEFARM